MANTSSNPQQEKFFCTHCGASQNANELFCSSCGNRLVNSPGQAVKSPPISIQLPKLSKLTQDHPVVIILGIIVGLIAICSFLGGTTSLSGLLRGRVPHHGAFVRQFIGYKELTTTTYGYAKENGYSNWSKFPAISKNSTILLWEPETDLRDLGLSVIYPDGGTDRLPTEISSDDGYLYLTPSIKLSSDFLYCYVAGSPILTVSSLPAWCFTVR